MKIWAHIAEFGPERLGATISDNCQLVRKLAALVDAAASLERLAPVETSICCFRYVADRLSDADLDALNEEIVIRLHETGVAAPSTTRVKGKLAIRVNITNHRTRESDLHLLLDAIRELATEALEKLGKA